MAILQVEDIQKRFGRTRVLEDISFSLEQGQAMAIIGSSGSGKTTLLRCLNFLEQPDRGRITVGGEVLFDADDPATQKESEIRRKRLHFGLVFQNFNLFPQYTALQNVMLASELLAKEQPDYHARKKELHEEIRRTTLGEAADYYAQNPPKGEFVLVVRGAEPPEEPEVSTEDGLERVGLLREEGLSLRDAVKRAAKELGLSRNELYSLALEQDRK